MFGNFKYRGLHHLELYCILIIEAWLKSNMCFESNYQELLNACILKLVFIFKLSNVKNGIEIQYSSIVVFSIH